MENNNCGYVESLSTETAKREGWKYWISFALSMGNIELVECLGLKVECYLSRYSVADRP